MSATGKVNTHVGHSSVVLRPENSILREETFVFLFYPEGPPFHFPRGRWDQKYVILGEARNEKTGLSK